MKKDKKKKATFWYKFSRNKAAVVGLVIFVVFMAAIIISTIKLDYQADAISQNLKARKLLPSLEHLFGTDAYGRDMFARIMFGAWYSLGIGVTSVAIATAIGTVFGTLAAYYGKLTDNVIMRIVDVFLAIPSTLMAIIIVASFGSSPVYLSLALVIATAPTFCRVARSAVMPVRETEYVQAAKAGGASDAHIILHHILPNAIGPILVQATMSVSKTILAIAGLGFIGLGISAPTPEWGTILSENKNLALAYPHLVIIPGLAILLMSLAINLIGDGLRDVLDPKAKY